MAPTNAQKYFGFILLKSITSENQDRLVEFLCAHNTQTMFVGYMTTRQSKVTVRDYTERFHNCFFSDLDCLLGIEIRRAASDDYRFDFFDVNNSFSFLVKSSVYFPFFYFVLFNKDKKKSRC